MAIARLASLDELRRYIAGECPRRIDEIVLHHTWRPLASQYAGASTWEAIRRYHMDVRGWSDIGYHFGVGPDDSIWRLRHHHKSGAHVLNRNAHTIGVVMVGDFDREDPGACGLAMAAAVVRVLCDRFGVPASKVMFHRDFADKSCPGGRLDRADFRRQVMGATSGVAQAGGEAGGGDPARPQLVTIVNGQQMDLGIWIDRDTGMAYGPLRRIVEALGGSVEYDSDSRRLTLSSPRE